MRYIALTGAIGHGKTTVSDMLSKYLPNSVTYETGQIITTVANELQLKLDLDNNPLQTTTDLTDWTANLADILSEISHTEVTRQRITFTQSDIDNNPVMFVKLQEYASRLQANPELAHAVIDSTNKAAYRPLLQWIGGYVVKRVDEGFWFKAIIKLAEKAKLDGTEFCIMNALRFPAEVRTVKQVNAHILKVERPELANGDTTDITERESSSVEPDTVIVNDADIYALEVIVDTFTQDYKMGTPKEKYKSSTVVSS